jgi:predicted phosphoribosyltransferase
MFMLTRAEAGRRLALGLGALVRDVPAVVAVSPGGVRVASEIARAFDAPLDVIASCRLEVPGRPHSVFGAVADGSVIVLPDRVRALGLPEDYVAGLVDIARQEVDRAARASRGGAPQLEMQGRTVVLVDDGLSDCMSVAASAQSLREHGAHPIVYAAPMATPELLGALEPYCGEHLLLYAADAPAGTVICEPEFEQTTRLEVGAMIRRSRSDLAAVT